MHLEPFRFTCFDGTCPTVYKTDRGTYIIQGYTVADTDVTPPAGEALVEVPMELLRELDAGPR